MTRRRTLFLLAAPLVAGTLLVALYAVLEVAGARPLTDRPLNLAEAVADDDPVAVARQLYEGASPLARYPIGRDVLLRASADEMTPLEVAALRDRAPLMDLIFRHGVPLDGETRAHLLCIAGRAGARDVLALLDRPGAVPVCSARVDTIIPAPPAP